MKALELVQGYAQAVFEEAAGSKVLDVVCKELDNFSILIDKNEHLMNILADPGLPAYERVLVVEDLLENRANRYSIDLLGFVIRNEPAIAVLQIISTLSSLSELASLSYFQKEPELEGLWVTAKQTPAFFRQRLGGYTTRVLSGLPSEELKVIEDEIFNFLKLLLENDSLTQILANSDIPPRTRREILFDLLSTKAHFAAVRLIDHLINRYGRLGGLTADLEWLMGQVAQARGFRLGKVRSAFKLTGSEKDHLRDTLSRMVGVAVELRAEIDPSLIGGFIVAVGDVVIDASVSSWLNQLKRRLFDESVRTTPDGKNLGSAA
ncbi:MAG: ATP synthase F1 subunit delta [Actinobacteria bacterium]|nr:ATP synthase F1 subunit delta [Actinomycetota bacterium]